MAIYEMKEQNQRKIPLECPMEWIAIARTRIPLNRPITKNGRRISHSMSKLKQREIISLFTPK
jgi:hypothetical protein